MTHRPVQTKFAESSNGDLILVRKREVERHGFSKSGARILRMQSVIRKRVLSGVNKVAFDALVEQHLLEGSDIPHLALRLQSSI